MAKRRKKSVKKPGSLKAKLQGQSTMKRIRRAIRAGKQSRADREKNWTIEHTWKGILQFVQRMETEGYTYRQKRDICNKLQIGGGAFACYKEMRRTVYMTRLAHNNPFPPLYEWGDGYPIRTAWRKNP